MKVLRILLIISPLLCPSAASADIYRYVDEAGVVHYTNTPCDPDCELYLREAPKNLPEQDATSGSEANWMLDYADRYSRSVNLSPALVRAIIKAESNNDRLAVSPKGAQGMMQLMPFTSRQLKVKDPFDPIQNIRGGVDYLRQLLGEFQGNLVHAVAAYNAGPEAVKKYNGIPPYRETRNYVKRVMDYYQRYSTVE